MYSGDAFSYVDNEDFPQLRFDLPREGVLHYADCWVLPKSAPNVDLAQKFVRYLLQPEVHVENALCLQVQVVTQTAVTILQEKHKDNTRVPFMAPNADLAKALPDDSTSGSKSHSYCLESPHRSLPDKL